MITFPSFKRDDTKIWISSATLSVNFPGGKPGSKKRNTNYRMADSTSVCELSSARGFQLNN